MFLFFVFGIFEGNSIQRTPFFIFQKASGFLTVFESRIRLINGLRRFRFTNPFGVVFAASGNLNKYHSVFGVEVYLMFWKLRVRHNKSLRLVGRGERVMQRRLLSYRLPFCLSVCSVVFVCCEIYFSVCLHCHWLACRVF